MNKKSRTIREEALQLLKAWDWDKNGSLTPDDVTIGSDKKIWWKCDNGHSYSRSPYLILSKGQKECPYCSGYYVTKGVNDLATLRPDLALEWDYEANGSLTPDTVKAKSGQKVGWKCKEGHRWSTNIAHRYNGTNCPYCSNKRLLIGYNDLATVRPDLAKEWDYEKNGGLKPTDVAAHASKMAWWKCDKGHSWPALISNRTRGTGCPDCLDKSVLSKNRKLLVEAFPDIAAEWDSDKNEGLDVSTITTGSSRKAYWLCKKGHSYAAIVYHRTHGSGCPYCSGRLPIKGETDLATLMPDILKEWDFSKNTDIQPDEVTRCSTEEVWWKCEKGHEWKNKIASKVTGTGECPYCANKKVAEGYNDLATLCPELAKEWDYEKNGDLKPQTCLAGTSDKVYWICSKGHSWKASVNRRRKGAGCPYCANMKAIPGENDFETLYPALAAEWDYEKNDITPNTVSAKSAQKYWWKCNEGHSYPSTPWRRIQGHGCPYCAGSIPIPGENDLSTLRPDIIKDWDYRKNGKKQPSEYTEKSGKTVWWKCSVCGQEWSAKIISRTLSGSRCPNCKGKGL